jgi:tetratricopeptide (TPR) repeat protein
LYYVAQGEFDRALALARRASQIDPLSPLAQMAPAWVLYFARRYREAIDHVRQLLSVSPDWGEARGILMLGFERLGDFERAASFIPGSAIFSGLPAEDVERLAQDAARGGPREYWEARLRLFQLPDARLPSYYLAVPRVHLGHADEAFALLDRAVEGRNGQLVFAAVDPALDPIRDDPRFERLLRTIGVFSVQRAAN